MEVRLQSGKLILVEEDKLGEIGKLRGFLTEEEMEQLEKAANSPPGFSLPPSRKKNPSRAG